MSLCSRGARSSMLGEEICDPAGDGYAFMARFETLRRGGHRPRAHCFGSRRHQGGRVVAVEFGVALHTKDIVTDIEGGIGTECR